MGPLGRGRGVEGAGGVAVVGVEPFSWRHYVQDGWGAGAPCDAHVAAAGPTGQVIHHAAAVLVHLTTGERVIGGMYVVTVGTRNQRVKSSQPRVSYRGWWL